MTDDNITNDSVDQEAVPPPELIDWWVWGVRKLAAIVADLVLGARIIPLFVVVLKGATWALTQDPNELLGVGVGVAAFFALWGSGELLGRYSAERNGPDPESWFIRQRRVNGDDVSTVISLVSRALQRLDRGPVEDKEARQR